MQFKQAGDFILNKLKKELSGDYTYHNVDHITDVYRAAEKIAKLENVSVNDTQLLLTAALYHDSGFLIAAKGHEEISCRIAKKVLPGFDYTAGEIDTICGMIMATKVPQSPKTHLERILVDADLDYLGRDDFFTVGHRLYTELSMAGSVGDKTEWNKMQLHFMETHRYFTKSAINLRRAKKEANMAEIKAALIN